MTQERQYREPRAAVIRRYTTEAIRNSHHTDASFAAEVAERYMALVAPNERTTTFHVGTDADSIVKAGQRNAKLIERFRDGTTKLPADVEEAWVEALPDPWRLQCARELARRYGFMGALAPSSAEAAQMLCTASMLVEFGQAVQALVEVNTHGADGARGVALRRRARAECADVISELMTLKATLQQMDDSTGPRAVPAPIVADGDRL